MVDKAVPLQYRPQAKRFVNTQKMQHLLALRWAASRRFVSGINSASISATFASSSARLSGSPCHGMQTSVNLNLQTLTGSANAGGISGAASDLA